MSFELASYKRTVLENRYRTKGLDTLYGYYQRGAFPLIFDTDNILRKFLSMECIRVRRKYRRLKETFLDSLSSDLDASEIDVLRDMNEPDFHQYAMGEKSYSQLVEIRNKKLGKVEKYLLIGVLLPFIAIGVVSLYKNLNKYKLEDKQVEQITYDLNQPKGSLESILK